MVLAVAILAATLIITNPFPSTVSAAPNVGTNHNITNESHGQNEPNIAVNPLHSTLQPRNLEVAVGANDYRGGRSALGLYTCYSGITGDIIVSNDFETWSRHTVSTPNYDAYGNPVLEYDSLGNLYYAYMAFNVDSGGNGLDATIYVSKSTDSGGSWEFYTRISSLGSGNNPYNDRPWLAIDRSNNNIYITWTVWHGRGTSCLGSDIMFARSTDGGATFSSPMRISSDYSTNGQQRQWSQIAIGPSGEVYVTWRRFGATGISRAIFMAKSTDNGQSFGTEAIVKEYPDFDSGDSGGFTLWTSTWPDLAIDSAGYLYITWHTATATDGDRELCFVRSTDGGSTWSSVMTVASNTKDQFWPVLAVSSSGRIDMVWYDRRLGSPSNTLVNLYYTSSVDQGTTFNPSVTRVTTASSDPTVPFNPGAGEYFGDIIDVAETSDGAALAVWTDSRSGNQEIYLATIAQPTVRTLRYWGGDDTHDFNEFLKTPVDEIIRIAGIGFSPSMTYNVYVVNDVSTWTNSMPIPNRVPGTTTTITTGPSGNIGTDIFSVATLWNAPTVTGEYDIVVDGNNNGLYDQGVDALYDNNVGTAGFVVLREPQILPAGDYLTYGWYLPDDGFYVEGWKVRSSEPVAVAVTTPIDLTSPGWDLINGEYMFGYAFGTVTPAADGHFSESLVWGPPLPTGTYAVWVDINNNGMLDFGDALSGSIFVRGFETVPGGFPNTVSTSTGSGNAYFAPSAGTLSDLTAVAEDTLPTTGKPPNMNFPDGLFSFSITGLTPGQTVTVILQLPSNVPIGYQYWKYNTNTGWFPMSIGSDDGDNIISITITDGGTGDADGLANGVIVDPGGPGICMGPEQVIPEVPIGTVLAAASMIIAFGAYLTMPKWRSKRLNNQ